VMDALLSLFPLLFVLACPLMMVLMMRGGHGHSGHDPGQAEVHDPAVMPSPRGREERIAELEREVERLRGEQAGEARWLEAGPR
jgi:hypothetical protein